jgi:carboxylate-amine ligase
MCPRHNQSVATSQEEHDGPDWSRWSSSDAYTLGIEEEVMLLDPEADWALAQRIDDVLPQLSEVLGDRVAGETHGSAVELSTDPHASVADASAQTLALREELARELQEYGLRTASAGTHPFAVWSDMQIAGGDRHQEVYGSMRELARREPTFALHVHIGVGDAESAIVLHNRMRGHLALLLALATNSPFWQGRDTGLASARIPIFQAFPRVGVPRAFADYGDYVETVDLLLRCEAFSEPTFLWWDLRPQPKFGTIEVRIMDAQTRPRSTSALVALLQSIAHLELEEGYLTTERIGTPELLAENRFIASRDGVHARLIDPVSEQRVPVESLVSELMPALEPHAERLGCSDALAGVPDLVRESGADEQLRVFREHESLPALVAELADDFCAPAAAAR